MSISKKTTGFLTTIYNNIKVNTPDLLSHSALLSKLETIENVLTFVNDSDRNIADVYYELSRINKKNTTQSHVWLNSKLDSLSYSLTNKVLDQIDNMCTRINKNSNSLVILDAKTEQLLNIAIPYDNRKGIIPCDQVIYADIDSFYLFIDSNGVIQLVNAKEEVADKKLILINKDVNTVRDIYSFFNNKLNVNMFKSQTEFQKQFTTSVFNKSLFDKVDTITVQLNSPFNSFIKNLIQLAIDSVGSNAFTISHCPIKGAIWNIPVGIDTHTNTVQYCQLYMDQLVLNLITGKSLKNVLYANNHTFKQNPITVYDIHDFVHKYREYTSAMSSFLSDR